MERVFVNGTWHGRLSNRRNVPPMMTILRPPVKTSCTVYARTTKNNKCDKGKDKERRVQTSIFDKPGSAKRRTRKFNTNKDACQHINTQANRW